MTLAQHLGYPASTRLVILNCDDLGMCQAATEGCELAMREGLATSASLMVPCPDATTAAQRLADLDVGVHLTLNSEWPEHRWGSLTRAASLGETFPCAPRALRAQADVGEVRAELRAQIEQALAWGVDVSHLDSHMYVAHDAPEYIDVYLDLAVDYRLPVRLSGSAQAPDAHRVRAWQRGVVAPDHLVALAHMGSRDDLTAALERLPAGVTEFHAHPAVDTPELRRLVPDWPTRVDDLDLYTTDVGFREAVEASGAVLIGYTELREVMRSRE